MENVSQHAFSEKVAVVTGTDNPVGRAVALQLALCGAYVVAASSSERVPGELSSLSTLVTATRFSGAEDAVSVADEVRAKFGRIDLLVVCPVFDQSSLSMSNGFESCVYSSFELFNACVPLAAGRPRFRVVNAFRGGAQGDIPSRTFSSALAELTNELNSSSPDNVVVNGVRYFERKGSNEGLDPDLFPAKSGIRSDDIARVVLFLLSGEAKAVSGQVLDAR